MQDTKLYYTVNFMQVLSAVGLTGMLISLFFFPGILYGLPQIPEQKMMKNSQSRPNDICSGTLLQNNTLFETEYLLFLQKKADECMEECKPFLQSDCNIASFAWLSKIAAHHFSVFSGKFIIIPLSITVMKGGLIMPKTSLKRESPHSAWHQLP